MEYTIEIRKNGILVVGGTASSKNIHVKKSFQIPLEAPIINQGLIVFDAATIATINRAFKTHKAIIKHANIIVNDRMTLTRDFEIPKVDKKKVSQLVHFEMTNLFNLSDNYIVDYRDLSDEDNTSSKSRVLASAVSIAFLESVELFCKALKIKIKGLESATSSMIRLLKKFELIKLEDVTVAIDITDTYVRNYLFDHSHFTLHRSYFIQEDARYEEVSERIFQVLDLLSQEQQGKSGQPISKIVLVGNREKFPILHSRYGHDDDIKVITPDISNFVKTQDVDILAYMNALGGLI